MVKAFYIGSHEVYIIALVIVEISYFSINTYVVGTQKNRLT